MLGEEAKTTSSDRFMSRFLLCVPEPSRISLKDLSPLDSNDENSLTELFITIKLMHSKPIRYRFTEEAFNYLSDCFDDYNMVSQKNECKNPFLRLKFCFFLIHVNNSLTIIALYMEKQLGN